MTDRELLELAREADPGFEGGPDADGTLGDSLVGIAAITRFAALVRAQVLDEVANMVNACNRRATPKGIAAAIRALKTGETK
jgi:hypothetical protein